MPNKKLRASVIQSTLIKFMTELTSVRQLLVQNFKGMRNETPLRERLNPRIRLKSELRNTVKMPPIASSQGNVSIQYPKNSVFPLAKTPLRKSAARGDGALPTLEDNLSNDYFMRNSKVLTIDTTGEPKNFDSLNENLSMGPRSAVHNENGINVLNPMTTKLIQFSPLSNNTFIKGLNGLKAKVLTKKHIKNAKPELLIRSRKSNTNEKVEFPSERPELIPQTENINTSSVANPYSFLPPLDPTRSSTKKNGIVKAYAANTNQGIVRNYNEDRVSIVLNILKPSNYDKEEEWPTCSFFGVYDGHGGTLCADFLRDNLHQFILRDENFPKDPVAALKNGFNEAEKQFTEMAQLSPFDINKSGSCAIVALIINDMCYIANVGDSRALMSSEQGKTTLALSRDHKPNEDYEKERILAKGGKVYQTQLSQPMKPGSLLNSSAYSKTILGPHRVFPGRLSVSRTFGDIEAKLEKFGGIPGVVIAEPDVMAYKITDENDFVILGCDGIFDKLSDEDVVRTVWTSTNTQFKDLQQQSSLAVESILNESMARKTLDNVTIIMICFEGFKKAVVPTENLEASFKGSLSPERMNASTFYEKFDGGVNTLQKSFGFAYHGQKKSLDFEGLKDGQKKHNDLGENNRQINPMLIPISLRRELHKGELSSSADDYGGFDTFTQRPKAASRRFKSRNQERIEG